MTQSKEVLFCVISLNILSRYYVYSSSDQNIQVCSLNTLDYERPGRNLCSLSGYHFNCTNQVASVHSNTRCEMKKINITECTDELFKGEKDKMAMNSVGTLKLIPYLYCDHFPYTSFNVTFNKPQWKRMNLRFIEEGLNIKRNCREFILSGDVDSASTISYDCFFDKEMGGKHYRFQYAVITYTGHELMSSYLFTAPYSDTMNSYNYNSRSKYHIFMMIDESDYSLKVQVPPKIFNVSNTTIGLYYKENQNSNAQNIGTKHIDLTNKEENDFINIFESLDPLSAGYYYYNATFYSSYCEDRCQFSFTPDFQVKGVSKVLVAAFLICLMVLSMMVYFTLKSKYREVAQGPEKMPNVLLIYESIFPSHIDDIYKFKEYLEENCFINVKMDLIDIAKTESKDPWEWYVKAFENADNVLVFASPAGDVEKGLHQDNVYHNLHVYAYKLLIFYLLHKNKCSKVAGIRLPGCSWETLPPEAQIINRYSRFALPYQLGDFFKFLKITPLIDGASKLSSVLMSPRKPPTLLISNPSTPLRYPDIDEEDNEIREQLISLDGNFLNFDQPANSQSEEDDDDDNKKNDILERLNV